MRRKLGVALPTVIALLCTLLYATPASAGQTYSYTAAWQGYAYALTPVANVVVASYADAKLAGQVTSFQTDYKKQACLDGLSINVYTAPAEFPGLYVANDDSQGTMCALGTWTFPIYAYAGAWLGYPLFSLSLIPNAEVESFPDASLVGTASNFQTQDAHFSCLNGQSLNVYTAPAEFPGQYVVHVIAGSCTSVADTWTFPIYSYSGSWNGATYSLTLLPNNEVQTAGDAKLITWQNNCNGTGQPSCGSPVQLQNLQTADPNFACVRGSSINVWMAQAEFPGEHVAHIIGGSACTGFGATWTFLPVTHYTITLKSYIPQAQLWDPDTSSLCSLLVLGSLSSTFTNMCPYVTYSSENAVFGTSANDPGVPGCYTPLDPLDTSVVGVFGGDGHTGFEGSHRTQTVIDFDWDPASRTIKNFRNTMMDHGVSSVTLYYLWLGLLVGGPCTVTDTRGLQSPPSGPTSNTSFTTGTSGWDPFIPGEANPSLCGIPYGPLAACGPYGDVIDATLKGSFNSDGSLSIPSLMTDWFPSYGLEVWPNQSYDAPQYRQTIVDESWVNTMSSNGLFYIGYALKYYNAMNGSCTPKPDPTGLIISMNYCINWSNTFNPAP